ncbi:ABC transporter ATP-binding protein [Nonomuraea aurantiaca]|uniref:ABC transporter ATP-binding protein n=1 Tax=Nonomuraea aurantiaca TaxID=2878562 RepID=UPI001CD931BD|nr:ABC transporter ATP-binding protein [Nonomuraea aurantiaca]MCA2220654.1 ABC transporter ATP-binding protein/permease [Nonomuraea aurantiaca]
MKETVVRAGDRLVMDAVRRSGPWPAVLAVAAIGGAAAELALPYVVGRTVDGFVSARPGTASWLAACAVIVAGIMLCESAGVWARGASSAYAAARLRLSVLRHVLGVGPAATRRFPEGELVTRAGLNAEEAGRAPEAVTGALALLVPTLGALAALTLIDPVLTATLVAGIALILFVLRAFLRATTTIAGGYQEVQGEIAVRLVDALGGARTIAAAGTADRETRRVLAPMDRLRAHGMELWRANASAGVQAGLIVPLVEVAVLAVGGLRLAAGELTIGELYAAARYAVLGAALSTSLGYIGGLARARAAAERVAEILGLPTTRYGTRLLPATHPPAGTSAAPAGRGTVDFRGVTMPGLAVDELVIPAGSVTAVVGRSGSGKSLLAALAARLADPAGGTVLLDGVPLPELDRAELRRAIGYAFERPVLVGDTVGAAIGLGADGQGVVAAAATAACADGFIRRLPGGYATPMADTPLSGGERQRIGLARAFAQGERLLVLDDATSSLDTVTERQVGTALTADPRGRTRLIVAHRLTTASRADRVVWLEDGRVLGHAPHHELWADPRYRAVFQGPQELGGSDGRGGDLS